MNFAEQELRVWLYLVDRLNKRISVLQESLNAPKAQPTPPPIPEEVDTNVGGDYGSGNGAFKYKDDTVRFAEQSFDPSNDEGCLVEETTDITDQPSSDVDSLTEIPKIEKFAGAAPKVSDLNENSADFLALAKQMVDVIEVFDSMEASLSEEQKEIALGIKDNIINGLIVGGCQPIETEVFDVSRHKLSPFANIAPGTPIVSVIREGVRFKDKVLLRAIVSV